MTGEPNDIFHSEAASLTAAKRRASSGESIDADHQDVAASSTKRMKEDNHPQRQPPPLPSAPQKQQQQRVRPQIWNGSKQQQSAETPSVGGQHEDEWRNIHVVRRPLACSKFPK
jgi:hypothetical protein